jgi:cellobiose dehydrogenase (acceptor)
MTLSQYLGRGSNSRGALTISGALTITVTDPPYLKTDGDKKAVVAGLTNLLKALATDSTIVVESPTNGTTPQQYVDNVSYLEFPV